MSDGLGGVGCIYDEGCGWDGNGFFWDWGKSGAGLAWIITYIAAISDLISGCGLFGIELSSGDKLAISQGVC